MKAPIELECPQCRRPSGQNCDIGEGAYYSFHHAARVYEAFREAIRQMKTKGKTK